MTEEFTVKTELDDIHKEMMDEVGHGIVEKRLNQELNGQIENIIYNLYREHQR